MLMRRSTDSIAWSAMCPAEMQASTPKTMAKKIVFGGPQIPHMSTMFRWIPFLGKYLNAFFVGLLHMPTPYERVADFMADDFTLGLGSQLIGQKIAPNKAP
jgi:hypothetical protein